MRALPQAQLSIYDLLQGGAYQRLRSAFAQFDIKIDPRSLLLNNQSKESVLSQILSQLESSPKLVNLAFVSQESFNQKEIQDYLSEKKSIDDAKIVGFIRCLQMYFLTQEAAQSYFKMEQLKILQHELRVLLLKLASAEYERQVQIAEIEKIKIMEAQRDLSNVFSNIFHESFDSCFKQLNDMKGKMHEYNNQLKDLKLEKHAIVAQMREDSLVKAIELKQICPELADIEDAVVADFVHRLRESQNKVESTLNKFDQKDKYDLKIIAEIDKDLATLDNKQTALDQEIRNAKHLYRSALVATKHDKQIRIPESMKLEFELRQKEIDESKQNLLQTRKYHQDNLETRVQKRENLKNRAQQIYEDERSKSPENLQNALAKPSVMEAVKEKLKSSLVDEKYLANKRSKNEVKILNKDINKEAKKLAAQQLKPAQQLYSLHHNQLRPSPKNAQIAAKAAEIEYVMKDIATLAAKTKKQKPSPRPA